MLCFNKLTGEHNTKKILLQIFLLWEYIFNDNEVLIMNLNF